MLFEWSSQRLSGYIELESRLTEDAEKIAGWKTQIESSLQAVREESQLLHKEINDSLSSLQSRVVERDEALSKLENMRAPSPPPILSVSESKVPSSHSTMPNNAPGPAQDQGAGESPLPTSVRSPNLFYCCKPIILGEVRDSLTKHPEPLGFCYVYAMDHSTSRELYKLGREIQ